MKPVSIFAVLTLIIILFFMIFLNKNNVADNNDNDSNKKIKNKIMQLKKRYSQENLNSRQYQSRVGDVRENHLSTKEAMESKKINLTKQMFDAKKECWMFRAPSLRILNGTDVEVDSMRWMAAIFKTYKETYKDTEFHCGGAIIATKFVLTAAHCVVDQNIYGFKIIKNEDLFVRYGMHDLSSKIYIEQQVERTFPHPDYFDLKGVYNDIALIKLKQPIKYTEAIKPVCVPFLTTPPKWDTMLPSSCDVLISGWGETSLQLMPSPRSSIKLQTTLGTTASHDYCKEFQGRYNEKTTLCLIMDKNTSKVCRGDMGGPVVPRDVVKEKMRVAFPVVIGIISFGNKTCYGAHVLTKVESFNEWINTMTI